MKREAIVFGLSGTFFGLLVGWIIGSQQAGVAVRPTAPPAAEQSSSASASTPSSRPAPALDQRRADELRAAAQQNPSDARSRVLLANLYFDAERYDEAIKWYEEALQLNPRDVDASTDLGVCYYYTNQPDRALAQFDKSLAVDPKHTKTILNMGIVRAFGKQDLAGAAQAWQRVIEIAPDSEEARAAKQALEGLKSAHPGMESSGRD